MNNLTGGPGESRQHTRVTFFNKVLTYIEVARRHTSGHIWRRNLTRWMYVTSHSIKMDIFRFVDERTLVRNHTFVHRKWIVSREWFLTGVRASITRQMAILIERLVADIVVVCWKWHIDESSTQAHKGN